MQTTFTLEQLCESHTAASEKILRSCVHCGFCTATCPTYLLEGDELDSPRGRIYLIKDMLEGGKPATEEVVKHLDRCLSCLSCMTTCPSGVHYMHLIDHARAYVEDTYRRGWSDRLLRTLLAHVLPYQARFRLALRAAALARPLMALLPKGRDPAKEDQPRLFDRLRAMLELAPTTLPIPPAEQAATPQIANGTARRRVVILGGCAQPVLKPSINAAAARLLARQGIEVVAAKGEGCCGALVEHMGREEQARVFARANIDAWMAEIETGGLDAILITASGCGTTVKDYGFLLRDDDVYAAKAAKISALTRDISEYLTDLPALPARPNASVIAYHSACSLQHGQRVTDAPKRLLREAGFIVRDIPEGHICCGSAGTYNMMQPFFARRLRARKIANIEKLHADIVAAGNIGCLTQLEAGLSMPIVHTIELLDWAYGGPAPEGLIVAN
ncbi:glycolate oxidase subunit GlcF [Methyloferula stellata]|uniref:glycolate oxidase subunit GlcF n=1 Tax=Methyloferula stellata TaxID=876270 RepID=UPI00036B91EB|nr:glycolate oxidase subunit GlcF [Methyloferula stellata]